MEDCVFCKIISREITANIVYESEDVIAFPDLESLAPTHVLIVPKKHIGTVLDFTKEDRNVILSLVEAAQKLIQKNKIEGEYRLRFNGGKAQHVPHVHWHLLGGKPYLIV